VTLAVESGNVIERGPDVRSTTIRTTLADRPRRDVLELSNVGGIVRDADGAPVADAWVALVELGKLATSGADGRFRLGRVPTGAYDVRVRDRDGREATVEVKVPSEVVDVVLGGAPAKAG
jgi:hypothetical protein